MSGRVVRVLFVCTGNICRSPTAHGVFASHVARAGLADRIQVDSAGTHDYHVGEPPDPRTIAAAKRRGYDLSPLRARPVERADLARFDVVLAMADEHRRRLVALARDEHRDRIALFLGDRDVPDPYYGDAAGFEEVLDLVEEASRGLLAHVKDL